MKYPGYNLEDRHFSGIRIHVYIDLFVSYECKSNLLNMTRWIYKPKDLYIDSSAYARELWINCTQRWFDQRESWCKILLWAHPFSPPVGQVTGPRPRESAGTSAYSSTWPPLVPSQREQQHPVQQFKPSFLHIFHCLIMMIERLTRLSTCNCPARFIWLCTGIR